MPNSLCQFIHHSLFECKYFPFLDVDSTLHYIGVKTNSGESHNTLRVIPSQEIHLAVRDMV